MTAPTTRGAPDGPPAGPPQRIGEVEAAIWRQAQHLNSDDPITRASAMEVVLLAVKLYAQEMAGPIVARRRNVLRGVLIGDTGADDLSAVHPVPKGK